jgi:hypothetical protein
MIVFLSYMFRYVNETFSMEYDQRVIIIFLHNKRANAHNITQRLQAQFTQDIYALRTVQFWIGQVHHGRQDIHDENCMKRLLLDDLDAKIRDILNKSPFESAQSISETLYIGIAIVLRCLHGSISFRSFHLHRMSHILTVELREK